MNKVKCISIITVVFNGIECIENTIVSVINQSYDNIDFVIIDGSSTDGTQSVIKKYESNISCWVSEPDKGIYDAMNKGASLARGEWILFMNCGDLFESRDTIANVVPYLSKEANIVYGDTLLSYGNKKQLKFKPAKEFTDIIYGIPFCHQSVFVELDIFKKYKFNLSYRYAADYNFFLSIFKNNEYRYKKVPFPISVYDMNGFSNGIGALGALKEYYLIAQKYYPNSRSTLGHYLRLKRYVYKMKIKLFVPKINISLVRNSRNTNN